MSNTEYYNSLTQNDIEWRMKKTGATLDELKAMAKASVQEFSESDKAAIAKGVDYVRRKLEAIGAWSLPFPTEDIVFVKTTMAEEGYSAAYTHKTEIYVGEKLLKQGKTRRSSNSTSLFLFLSMPWTPIIPSAKCRTSRM